MRDGEPSSGNRLPAGLGAAGSHGARTAGREPGAGRPGRHLFLMRFDRLVNAEALASFNLDQTRDLENKPLCAAGVKLSATAETPA